MNNHIVVVVVYCGSGSAW